MATALTLTWTPPLVPFALPAVPEAFDTSTEHLYANVSAPIQKLVEPAGRAYHQYLMEKEKLNHDDDADSDNDDQNDGEQDGDGGLSNNEFKFDPHAQVDLEDFYALLGLSDESFDATERQIKQNYRKISLTCHPDKVPTEHRDLAEQRFKAISQAYETLLDKQRRHVYDSSLEFDDSIPDPDECNGRSPDDFFALYAPVFVRNGRFSINKPVPKLGNMSTPEHRWNSFYNFWFSFKSWRDFSHLNEHNEEDAQDRYEKRWMKQQNDRKKKGAKKKEAKRIQRLVEQAFKLDPRVLEQKRAKAAEKEARRQEKIKRREERLAREQREKEIKAQKLEEAKQQALNDKKLQKQFKNRMKKLRSKVRKIMKKINNHNNNNNNNSNSNSNSSTNNDSISYEGWEIEELVGKSDEESLKSIVDLEDDQDANLLEQKALVDQILRRMKQEQEEAKQLAAELRAAKERKKQLENQRRQENKIWTKEELSLLSKAVAKYPGGARNRWEAVTSFINQFSSNELDRSVKETIKMAREVDRVRLIGDDLVIQQQLHNNNNTTTTTTTTSTMTTTTNKNNNNMTTTTATTNTNNSATSRSNNRNTDAKANSNVSSNNNDNNHNNNDGGDNQEGKTTKPKKDKKKAKKEWTAEAQSQLEAAMRAVPKTVDGDRWEQIAARVPGYTKKDCVRRFKEIRKKIAAARK